VGIKFNDFAIRGIDVSGFNDVFDWNEAQENNVNFSGIRVGYGRTTDIQFKKNWVNAKGKVLRMPYWYMDYYSNYNPNSPVYNMSDEDWGTEQANNCWGLIKNDPDCSIVWLDIESGAPSYSPTITTVPTRVYAIAKAFLQRMDVLNGKFNGIYCSLGLLSWFSSWFRNRPLWVAWYNESQTISSVIRNVSATGWTGKCLIWQYASDGDSTDDGIGDGQTLGNPYRWLDLNGWAATADEYKIFSNNQVVVPPIPDPDPLPNTPLYSVKVFVGGLNVRSSPEIKTGNILRTIGYVQMKIYEEKNGWGKISSTNSEWISLDPKYSIRYIGGTTGWVVTAWLGLNIRSEPNGSSTKLGALPYGTQFNVSSIDTNKWGKLYGRDGYVSLAYAKQLY
jgi:GH25 family lysozyme M1 (1,4-beta-N-acetylmuramidase)